MIAFVKIADAEFFAPEKSAFDKSLSLTFVNVVSVLIIT
jgi:hypothetical protein